MSRRWSRMMFVALLLLPLPALAQWATITSPVNVRAGPSHQFPVVTWLSTGTRVTVVGCTGSGTPDACACSGLKVY